VPILINLPIVIVCLRNHCRQNWTPCAEPGCEEKTVWPILGQPKYKIWWISGRPLRWWGGVLLPGARALRCYRFDKGSVVWAMGWVFLYLFLFVWAANEPVGWTVFSSAW
jgi:hypothetical protein